MAEERTYKTILEIEAEKSIKTIGALKENIKALNKEIDKTELNDSELSEKEKELAKQKEILNNLTRNGAKSFEEANKQAQGLDHSYNGLRARLASLTKEWHAVDRELEPDKWQDLAIQINNTRSSLKDMDANVGNFQRNVGDYKNQIVSAFQATAGSAGAMIAPIAGATAGLKAMSATPVIAILGLLAQVIAKVIEGFKSSEENVFALKKAFAVFQPIADAVTNTMQSLAKGIVKVVEWSGKLAKKLGLVNEKSKEHEDIAIREIELTKKQREADMANADAQLEIAKLKEKATDKLKYTNAERIGYLKKASDLELSISNRNRELAKEEYEILQIKAEWTGNDAETNDELANSYVRLQEAERAYFEKKKEINSQIVEATNAMKAEQKAQVTQEEEVVRRQIEFGQTTADLQIEQAQVVADTEVAIDNKRLEQILANQELEKQKALELAEAKKQIAMQSIATLSSVFGAMANLYESNEKTAGKNAGKIKALRIAEATMSTLKGAIDAYMGVQEMPIPPIAKQVLAVAQAGIVTATGIANINKIKATKIPFGGGSGTSTSLGAIGGAIASPVGGTNTLPPAYRTLTGAKTEESLENFGKSQKVYILSSDLEANGRKVEIRNQESTF